MHPPKAQSVTRQGADDGFVPPTFYAPEVLQGGHTRLTVSLPGLRVKAVHKAIVAALTPPFKLLYQQVTDRQQGQLPKPRTHVAVELPRDRVLDALDRYADLVYHDGRHQLWIRGAAGEQVVLEEIGMLYIYPDDFQFRDILEDNGVPEGGGESLATRDYIKVNFLAEADAQERALMQDLNLVPWDR